jgi:hypothetical protein
MLSGSVEGVEECFRSGIIPECFTNVRESIDIAWAENEAATELEWICTDFVLVMAGRACAVAALGIIATKNVEKVRGAQISNTIGLALRVD